jgi:hypothetical protein
METLLFNAAILVLLPCPLAAHDDQLKASPGSKGEEGVACHGTAVRFVETPVQAAKLAAQEKKLVFVLHVSGYFEDPKLT